MTGKTRPTQRPAAGPAAPQQPCGLGQLTQHGWSSVSSSEHRQVRQRCLKALKEHVRSGLNIHNSDTVPRSGELVIVTCLGKPHPQGQACLLRGWHSQCQLQGAGQAPPGSSLSGVRQQTFRDSVLCPAVPSGVTARGKTGLQPQSAHRVWGQPAVRALSWAYLLPFPLTPEVQEKGQALPPSPSLTRSRAVLPFQAYRQGWWPDPQGRGTPGTRPSLPLTGFPFYSRAGPGIVGTKEEGGFSIEAATTAQTLRAGHTDQIHKHSDPSHRVPLLHCYTRMHSLQQPCVSAHSSPEELTLSPLPPLPPPRGLVT